MTLVLWLLGVDFPLLWGVLTFFLSFIPYIGMFLASVPSVLLAWAEYDLAHAAVVAVALTVVNATAENLVQPALMHKGLHLSPTLVFVSCLFLGLVSPWRRLLPGSPPLTWPVSRAGQFSRGNLVRRHGDDKPRWARGAAPIRRPHVAPRVS